MGCPACRGYAPRSGLTEPETRWYVHMGLGMKKHNIRRFLQVGVAVWALAGMVAAQSWNPLSPSVTASFTGRYLAPTVFDQSTNQLILFGGFNGSSILTDVWRLSMNGSPAWTPLFPAGNTPQFVGSAVYDATNSRMILFGG